jgi:hypothetical protein
MLYQKAHVEHTQRKDSFDRVVDVASKLVIDETIVVDQKSLTSECWVIQIEGLKACEKCQYKDKPRLCGGMAIRKRLQSQPKSVRFKWLSGDINWMDYGGSWISNKLNNGEYDYWLVLVLTNLIDSAGEREAKEMGGKYLVSLNAVAPSQVSEQDLKKALGSWGVGELSLDEVTTEMRIEVLNTYGIRATLWYETGNNAHELLKEGRKHAREEGKDSFNRQLKSVANALGHTKSDALRGDLSFETAMRNRGAYEQRS